MHSAAEARSNYHNWEENPAVPQNRVENVKLDAIVIASFKKVHPKAQINE